MLENESVGEILGWNKSYNNILKVLKGRPRKGFDQKMPAPGLRRIQNTSTSSENILRAF